jgi:hypothetical protein
MAALTSREARTFVEDMTSLCLRYLVVKKFFVYRMYLGCTLMQLGILWGGWLCVVWDLYSKCSRPDCSDMPEEKFVFTG